jgi:hypothetical protein
MIMAAKSASSVCDGSTRPIEHSEKGATAYYPHEKMGDPTDVHKPQRGVLTSQQTKRVIKFSSVSAEVFSRNSHLAELFFRAEHDEEQLLRLAPISFCKCNIDVYSDSKRPLLLLDNCGAQIYLCQFSGTSAGSPRSSPLGK